MQPNHRWLTTNRGEDTLPIKTAALSMFVVENDVFDQVRFANAVC